jgi:hypothetical protein
MGTQKAAGEFERYQEAQLKRKRDAAMKVPLTMALGTLLVIGSLSCGPSGTNSGGGNMAQPPAGQPQSTSRMGAPGYMGGCMGDTMGMGEGMGMHDGMSTCDGMGMGSGNPGGACGDSTCADDEYCCNPSCGICAPYPDGVCTMEVCH